MKTPIPFPVIGAAALVIFAVATGAGCDPKPIVLTPRPAAPGSAKKKFEAIRMRREQQAKDNPNLAVTGGGAAPSGGAAPHGGAAPNAGN